MATVQEVVRRLRIEATSTGIDEVTGKLQKLSSTQSEAYEKAVARQQEMARIDREQMRMQMLMIQRNQEMARAANDNTKSWAMQDLEIASVANHLRQAAVAAYAISPAFRQMVNPAITAGARATSSALVAMGPAAASASLAVVRGLSPIAAAISRVLLPISLMKTGLDLTTEAWDLGGRKLEEYRSIAEKAAAVDLSTMYFQRISKAAVDAKLPVDTLTKALQNMQSATTEQLGGSALDRRLNEHLKAGNFAGNPGVAALGQANSTEEQFKAINRLIDDAMAKGQRLAALDIANTVFGPEITQRLRGDSEYLHNLQAAAEKISATQLVSDADVGRALELQRRYDAAVTILSERWHPIQGVLTEMGMRMQSAWIGIVEAIANAVDGVVKLVMKIGEIPASFWSYIQKGASMALPYAGAVGGAVGAAFGPIGSAVGWAVGTGANLLSQNGAREENQLAAAMKNTNNVRAAGTLGLKVYDNVIKDTSRNLVDHTEKTNAAANAYERAVASVEKQIAGMQANIAAIGLGAGALQELRTAAVLNTAAMQAGLPMTQAMADKIQDLAQDAGDAAREYETLKIASQIKFQRDTALLSPNDVAIAQQLRGIYPDVAQALNSIEAAGVRPNASLKRIVDTPAANDNQRDAKASKEGKAA